MEEALTPVVVVHLSSVYVGCGPHAAMPLWLASWCLVGLCFCFWSRDLLQSFHAWKPPLLSIVWTRTLSVTETLPTSWERWVSLHDKLPGKQQPRWRNKIVLQTFPAALWSHWQQLFFSHILHFTHLLVQDWNVGRVWRESMNAQSEKLYKGLIVQKLEKLNVIDLCKYMILQIKLWKCIYRLTAFLSHSHSLDKHDQCKCQIQIFKVAVLFVFQPNSVIL